MAERFKYDPGKTVRDNMWTALKMATSVFASRHCKSIAKMSRAGWEWDDIYDELLVRGFTRMASLLSEGWIKKHPGLNLMNCAYSAVWGEWGGLSLQIKRDYAHTKKFEDIGGIVPGTDGLRVIETISENSKLYHAKGGASMELDAIHSYLESCTEFNLAVDRELVIKWMTEMRCLPHVDQLPEFATEIKLIERIKNGYPTATREAVYDKVMKKLKETGCKQSTDLH